MVIDNENKSHLSDQSLLRLFEKFTVVLFYTTYIYMLLGVALGEDWKPRLPDMQTRKTKNIGACQDGHLTVD